MRSASDNKISAGSKRCNSSSNEDNSMFLHKNSPDASDTHANAARFLATANAATRFACLSGNNAVSVSVPGVTIRTIARSIGPFAAPASVSCSQMATDCPAFTNFAK